MARFSMLDIARSSARSRPRATRSRSPRAGSLGRRRASALRRGVPLRPHRGRAREGRKEPPLRLRSRKARDRAAAARELRPKIDELSRTIDESRGKRRALSRRPTTVRRCARCSKSCPTCSTTPFPTARTKTPTLRCAAGASRATFDFSAKPHWELGERLGILDFARAAKLSGSRFCRARGDGARLARALTTFFLDRAARRGYLEVAPPLLVSRATMWSTGQLSKFSDAMFEDARPGCS